MMGGLSILILAAGAARRMGKAKMLLPFGNSTILQTIIENAKAINSDTICMVTGYYHHELIASIADEKVRLVYNERWEEGMSGSIKKGLSYLISQSPEMKAVLILVADQPFISSALLNEMIQLQTITNKGIVAASYTGIAGTPVLFTVNHFSSLEKLSGDKGARSILQLYPNDLITVDFPLGDIDIDTQDDYNKLLLK